jgi:hypothetical protein
MFDIKGKKLKLGIGLRAYSPTVEFLQMANFTEICG